jgi:hypothetical protein
MVRYLNVRRVSAAKMKKKYRSFDVWINELLDSIEEK